MSSRRRRDKKERRTTAAGERPRPLAGDPRGSGPSFGEELRRERELRGISLREVAESTKISLRYLEAIERNAFDGLPGGVFTKGFVKAYAQFIGLDPEGTVNAYLLERRSQIGEPLEDEADDDGRGLLRELAREPGPADFRSRARSRVWLWGGVALAIVIAAAVVAVVVWRVGSDTDVASGEPAAVVAPPPARDEVVEEPAAAEPATQAVEAAGEDEDETTAPEQGPPVEPPRKPSPSPQAATPVEIRARVVLERATSGRLNCDNQRVEVLDGMPAGTVLELRCRKYLVLDASDGGGVRVGIGGASPAPLVADGVPLSGYRILPKAESGGGGASS